MELWLIRHGLPVRVEGATGPADPVLAPEGERQAKELARWWAPHQPDAIFASPLRRAAETAAPLAAALDLPVELRDGIKEFDAAENTYVPIEELRADEALWKAAIANWMSPEAEAARASFRADVVATIEEIASSHVGERVAIVCHGGVINAYLAHVLSLESTMFFEPAYTSVSRIQVTGGHRQLISVNERPHLEGLAQPTIGRL